MSFAILCERLLYAFSPLNKYPQYSNASLYYTAVYEWTCTFFFKPNTQLYTADATQLSSRVSSAVWTQFATIAHDDCRRIRSTVWELNIAVWLREFWSILITFSTMTSLCRHLWPTAQEIVNWVTTADGCVHTANTTQLDSWVASAVCIGHY